MSFWAQIGNISAAYANLSIMFLQSIRHDLFEKKYEEGGWQKTSLAYILPRYQSSGLHL